MLEMGYTPHTVDLLVKEPYYYYTYRKQQEESKKHLQDLVACEEKCSTTSTLRWLETTIMFGICQPSFTYLLYTCYGAPTVIKNCLS